MFRKTAKYIFAVVVFCFILASCTDVTPLTPQAPNATLPPTDKPGQVSGLEDYIVTYNYSDTGPVQLSENNISLKVGQKLILQPAAGFTGNTRFTSSGENFWGDIMQQQSAAQQTGTAQFTAIKAGKGKLTIIPNGTDTARAADLWATVQ